MHTRIKICGITNLEDALLCAEYGADALGFIFCSSPRRISPENARMIIKKLPPFIIPVGIFKDMPTDSVIEIATFTGISIIQLHGLETPEYCQKLKNLRIIKRIKVSNNTNRREVIEEMRRYYNISAFLFDPGEGSGKIFDWEIVKNVTGRIIIAGGLNEINVGRMIRILKPYGVDVCSGVERNIGKKDPLKVKNFIREVRRCY
uniref:N-(5'-phosphoribosyl)anthranilate isomerase n=1 Tax=candidate division WOR-3 bacterium TaxID=2052148 RepID=A0A7V3RGT2_UNCW3